MSTPTGGTGATGGGYKDAVKKKFNSLRWKNAKSMMAGEASAEENTVSTPETTRMKRLSMDPSVLTPSRMNLDDDEEDEDDPFNSGKKKEPEKKESPKPASKGHVRSPSNSGSSAGKSGTSAGLIPSTPPSSYAVSAAPVMQSSTPNAFTTLPRERKRSASTSVRFMKWDKEDESSSPVVPPLADISTPTKERKLPQMPNVSGVKSVLAAQKERLMRLEKSISRRFFTHHVTAPTSKPENRPRVRVIKDHRAKNEAELTLKMGDVITIIQMQEGGFWKGELHGNVGIFHCDFVESIPTAPSAASSAAHSRTNSSSDLQALMKKQSDATLAGAASALGGPPSDLDQLAQGVMDIVAGTPPAQLSAADEIKQAYKQREEKLALSVVLMCAELDAAQKLYKVMQQPGAVQAPAHAAAAAASPSPSPSSPSAASPAPTASAASSPANAAAASLPSAFTDRDLGEALRRSMQLVRTARKHTDDYTNQLLLRALDAEKREKQALQRAAMFEERVAELLSNLGKENKERRSEVAALETAKSRLEEEVRAAKDREEVARETFQQLGKMVEMLRAQINLQEAAKTANGVEQR